MVSLPIGSRITKKRVRPSVLAFALTVAGFIASGLLVSNGAGQSQAPRADQAEDIRTTQDTVLEAAGGEIAKLLPAARAFTDTEDQVGGIPVELTGRRFIRGSKRGVTAKCSKAGNVIAITSSSDLQVKALTDRGFSRLDFPEFPAFKNDPESKAVAFQKVLNQGESVELPGWVLLTFGPEERGGIPFSRMRSLDPPVFLPDGSEFRTWEVPQQYSKTLHVDQAHAKASDSNPGTREMPLKTINRAAQLLQPGERVVVQTGVYREWVRPARGGTDPEHMISYEAAPGARVVIKGSEILRTKWRKSYHWGQTAPMGGGRVWTARLPGELFGGYNPFGLTNYPQVDELSYWNLREVFSDSRAPVYLQVRGLIFQNGRRLRQVSKIDELDKQDGLYWVEPHGMTLHVGLTRGRIPTMWNGRSRRASRCSLRRNTTLVSSR